MRRQPGGGSNPLPGIVTTSRIAEAMARTRASRVRSRGTYSQ